MQAKRSTLSIVIFVMCFVLFLTGSSPETTIAESDWVISTVATPDPSWTGGPSYDLAVDASGIPHVSYNFAGEYKLFYAYLINSNWSHTLLDNSGSASSPTRGYNAIAVDGSGFPHISYKGAGGDASINYVAMDTIGWNYSVVTGSDDRDNAIALSPTYPYTPTISYVQHRTASGTAIRDMKVARWDGNGWVIDVVESAGDVGGNNDIALSATYPYAPHISYNNLSGKLIKYATWNGTSWQVETVDSFNLSGQQTSIALDQDDRPHICYSTGGAFSEIRHAYKDSGGQWQIEIIGNGAGCTIAVGTDNIARITYQDAVSLDLLFLEKTGAIWQSAIVDSNAGGGRIALDAQNKPHIVYVKNGAILYAVKRNLPPEVYAGGSYSGQEGASIPLSGASALDQEGDILTYSWSVNSSLCDFSDETILNPNLSCTDNGNFTITLMVNDGVNEPVSSEATVSVENVAPAAHAYPSQTVFRNETVTLMGTWSDPAGEIDNPYSWSWDLDGDGLPDDSGNVSFGDSILRTTNFVVDGLATLTFTVTDKDGGFNSDTVIIEVINRVPQANGQDVATNEDSPVNIFLTGSDLDGDSLDFSLLDNPTNGTLSGTPPNLTYMPNADFNGNDNFTFKVNDGLVDSNEAAVNITVNPINDPPEAINDTITTDEDVAVVIDVQNNDNAGPTNENQALITTDVTDPPHGTAEIKSNGAVIYTPDLDFNGVDDFDYTVCDSDNTCDTATVTVLVDMVNDPPVAENDIIFTAEDTLVTMDVVANDYDVDGNLDPSSVIDLSLPTNGSLVNIGNGVFAYTPGLNFNGSDGFNYEVCDMEGVCESATVNITVTPVNDAPVCTNAVPSSDVIWPPNHQFEPITISGVTDVEGDIITITITSIFQDEPVDSNGDGSFAPDGLGIGTDTAQVRAERQGGGNGRYYHINFAAYDGNGGTCSGVVLVSVPKSQGKQGAAIDDGPLYDSTLP